MELKDLKKEIIITADGSSTVQIPDWNVTYHSRHGAVQESLHVFIDKGLYAALENFPEQPLHIFEMGFGTGLNALLTAMEAQIKKVHISYTAVEINPLSEAEINALNFFKTLSYEPHLFQQLHQCPWNQKVQLMEYFTLEKVQTDLISFSTEQLFHVIYYDAFAPGAQPELWTQRVFKKLYDRLHPNGLLVTYCSKGDVRRAMIAAGFTVKKLPGPPGKREMLRAEKISDL